MRTDFKAAARQQLLTTTLVMSTSAVAALITACVGVPDKEPCAANNGTFGTDDHNSRVCYPVIDCTAGLQPAEVERLEETPCMPQVDLNCVPRRVNRGKVAPCLDFADEDLRYVDLHWEHLQGSSFAGADLSGAIVSDCDLREANFRGATLHNTDLIFSILFRADFTDADLTGAHFGPGSPDASLRGAIIHNTICPDGTLADDSCNDHVLE